MVINHAGAWVVTKPSICVIDSQSKAQVFIAVCKPGHGLSSSNRCKSIILAAQLSRTIHLRESGEKKNYMVDRYKDAQ